MSNENQANKTPAGIRLYLGLFFFVLSWLMPFTGIWIAQSHFPAAVKAILIGLLSIGGPEIIALISITILGKECFEFIVSKCFSFLKNLAPKGSVSKLRYQIGLCMFVLPLLPWYILAYAPEIIPASHEARLAFCLASDLCFWSSLFVLGGDFWDKLRSLFIYEARAVIPPAVSLAAPDPDQE